MINGDDILVLLDRLRADGYAIGVREYITAQEIAAAFLEADSVDPTQLRNWLAPVLEVVVEVPETSRGVVSALGWVDREKLQGQVVAWLKADQITIGQKAVDISRWEPKPRKY